MFKTRCIPALLAAAALGCSDAELDTGTEQTGLADARQGFDAQLDAEVDGGIGDADPPAIDESVAPMDADPPLEDAAFEPETGPIEDMNIDPPLPPRLVAAVVLSETPQADLSAAAVSVSEPIEIGGAPGCVVQNVNPDASEPASPSFDAGDITVTGLADGQPMVFAFGGDAYQAGRAAPTNLFGDNAMLVAEGAGGPALGGFRIEFPAPTSVSLQSPSNLAQASRNNDLSVRWNAGNGDTVLVTVVPTESGFSSDPIAGNWIFCGTDDTGTLTVPSASMRQLPDGGFLGQGALVVVTRFTVRTQTVGGPDREAVGTASTSTGALITVN
jgi:hypothetical protein